MKKALVLAMALSALANVYAGDQPCPYAKEGMGHGKPDFSSLNLTEDQKTRMQAMREKHMAEKQAMRERHQADMKVILTEEQWAKHQEMMKKHMEQMPMKGKRMEGKNKPE